MALSICIQYLVNLSTYHCLGGTIAFPILQLRKEDHGGTWRPAQDHRPTKWQNYSHKDKWTLSEAKGTLGAWDLGRLFKFL